MVRAPFAVASTTYSYDATSQLTGADYTGQTDESFTYDSNGNRLASGSTVTYSTGDHNRILSDGIFTYSYDAEGNRTSKTEISTGEVVEYSWSHVNQLTAVTYKDANNVVTKSVTYRYDALGRRIGKSVDETGDGIVDRSETYIYDGAGLLADASGSIHISGPNGATKQHGWVDQMVLSFVDADGEGSGVATLASRNLYGSAVDQIFATEVDSGDVLWALSDHQSTVRDWATFDDATDTTTVAAHIRYSSFGSIEAITDSSGNPLAVSVLPLASYTGQLYDADADLLYYRARWYDPQLGKFLNDDPMGFAAGDVNVSRYVGNATVRRTDASGLYSPIPDGARVGKITFIGTEQHIAEVLKIWKQLEEKAKTNAALNSVLNEMKEAQKTTIIFVENGSAEINGGNYRTSAIDIADLLGHPTTDGPNVSQSEILLHEVYEQYWLRQRNLEPKDGHFEDAHEAAKAAESLVDHWVRGEGWGKTVMSEESRKAAEKAIGVRSMTEVFRNKDYDWSPYTYVKDDKRFYTFEVYKKGVFLGEFPFTPQQNNP